MSTLRDQILAADDLKVIAVDVPEWGCTVHVRTMSGGERDAFEERQQRDPFKDIRARLAVLTVCDEEGNLLFTDADIPALTKKSAAALDRIFAAATKLNKFSKEDLDELQKN